MLSVMMVEVTSNDRYVGRVLGPKEMLRSAICLCKYAFWLSFSISKTCHSRSASRDQEPQSRIRSAAVGRAGRCPGALQCRSYVFFYGLRSQIHAIFESTSYVKFKSSLIHLRRSRSIKPVLITAKSRMPPSGFFRKSVKHNGLVRKYLSCSVFSFSFNIL